MLFCLVNRLSPLVCDWYAETSLFIGPSTMESPAVVHGDWQKQSLQPLPPMPRTGVNAAQRLARLIGSNVLSCAGMSPTLPSLPSNHPGINEAAFRGRPMTGAHADKHLDWNHLQLYIGCHGDLLCLNSSQVPVVSQPLY